MNFGKEMAFKERLNKVQEMYLAEEGRYQRWLLAWGLHVGTLEHFDSKASETGMFPAYSRES